MIDGKVKMEVSEIPVLNMEIEDVQLVHITERDHNKLNNRDAADQHPIEAITGLRDKLSEVDKAFEEQGQILEEQNQAIEEQGKVLEGYGQTLQLQGAAIESLNQFAEEAGKTLTTLGETVENQGETLTQHGETIAKQGETITKQEQILENHSQTLQSQGVAITTVTTVANSASTKANEAKSAAVSAANAAVSAGAKAAEAQTVATEAQNDAANAHFAADHLYKGVDLTVKFKSEIDANYSGNPWKWIQARKAAGNFDGLHVCDYIPITTTNGVSLQAQIAGMDTYYQYGDSAVGHHIDFITREIWPTLYPANRVNYNNGTAEQQNPWLASDLYLWLNSLTGKAPNSMAVNPEMADVDYTTDGVYYFLPDELKDVIIEKRYSLEGRYSKSSLLSSSNGWAWRNAGKLWLPTEMEVYGTHVWGNAGFPTGGGIQYPIFANSMNRLKLKQGSRYGWWLATPHSGSSTTWCAVSLYGGANYYYATYTWLGTPVCFRI